jgi:hypothetical protein
MENYKPPTGTNTYARDAPDLYLPPNYAIYNPPPVPPPYAIGTRVKFSDGRSDTEWKGRIENIQYIIQPDGARELMPIDLNYIKGSDIKGGRFTKRNKRQRRKTRHY